MYRRNEKSALGPLHAHIALPYSDVSWSKVKIKANKQHGQEIQRWGDRS